MDLWGARGAAWVALKLSECLSLLLVHWGGGRMRETSFCLIFKNKIIPLKPEVNTSPC